MVKNKIMIMRRKCLELVARHQLKRHSNLWQCLHEYLAKTESTGCGYVDYWYLYRSVMREKPSEILECGTGVSTLVIAMALVDLERMGFPRGRVTSMESHGSYLEMSKALLPDELHAYVDFQLSDVCEDTYSLFRGVRYADIPDRPYDFVFVDGPDYTAPSDGMKSFDFDFIYVLNKSTRPVSGLVDKRVSTCFVLQQLLGSHLLRYDPVAHLGFIKAASKDDLIEVDKQTPSRTFEHSFRAFGTTLLKYGRLRAWSLR